MEEAEWTSKTQALIIGAEGRRRRRYFDKLGHPSIGIGFNLERGDAIEKLKKLGADWRNIMDGAAELNDEQVNTLFGWCYAEALTYARELFGNWENIIPEAQSVLVDMSFQLHSRLLGFSKMRDAVARLDYGRIISEMRSSHYAKQVPERVARNVAIIEAATANEGDVC
jgi:GH24 family phage-related lysozyme (muramidase)